MKAKMAFIALALFAGQAKAEWAPIGQTHLFVVFLEKSTIRKQSGYTLMWALNDYFKPYKEPKGDVYSSAKNLWVAKCEEYQIGLKTTTQFSGNMGNGEIVYQSPSQEFHQIVFIDVEPGSVAEGTFNIMCGIK